MTRPPRNALTVLRPTVLRPTVLRPTVLRPTVLRPLSSVLRPMDPLLLVFRVAVVALAAWLWWWGRQQAKENARLRDELDRLRDERARTKGAR
ncbi:MAG: hypothetical protein AAGI91_10640 [Bacteroidota bacterium]